MPPELATQDLTGAPSQPSAEAPREGRGRRRVAIAVKTALSLLLIAFLVRQVDWPAMREHLTRVRPFWISVAFAIWLAQYVVNGLKWQAAMRVHRLYYPLGFLIRVYLISSFFTNFFPSSLGGDGYRVLRTLPESHRSRAVSSVMLERLVGVASLLFLGLIGALAVWAVKDARIAGWYVAAAATGALALAVGLALVRTSLAKRLWWKLRSNAKIDGLAKNFDYIRSDSKGVARVFAYSLLFQGVAISAVWIIARLGLGVEFTVPEIAMTAALAELATAVPVSLNGLGVTEGAFAYVSTEIGIAFDHGLLVAVTLRLLLVPLGIVCGLIYLAEVLSGRTADRPETQAP